jgi:hypothetical protein
VNYAYPPLKPRPLRHVTNQVRDLNTHFDGPGTVCLVAIGGNEFLEVMHVGSTWPEYGSEDLPGDGLPVDAVAVARRLLAAWRDAGEPRWESPGSISVRLDTVSRG